MSQDPVQQPALPLPLRPIGSPGSSIPRGGGRPPGHRHRRWGPWEAAFHRHRVRLTLKTISLAGAAQWTECWPMNQRSPVQFPDRVPMPGLRARSPMGGA